MVESGRTKIAVASIQTAGAGDFSLLCNILVPKTKDISYLSPILQQLKKFSLITNFHSDLDIIELDKRL